MSIQVVFCITLLAVYILHPALSHSVIREENDLVYDHKGYLKQSYILYSLSPACTRLMTTAQTNYKELRVKNIFAYDVHSQYGKKLLSDAQMLNQVLIENACSIVKITQGTPQRMVQHTLPGENIFLPIIKKNSGGDEEELRLVKEMARVLYQFNQIEISIVNHYLGKPVIIEFTGFLNGELALVSTSTVLDTGMSACFKSAIGYPIRVTSDYRYNSTEVSNATKGQSNAENRRFVEGAPDANTGSSEYELQILLRLRKRTDFVGYVIHDEIMWYTTTRYMGYYDYVAMDEPNLATLHRAKDLKFGLRGKTLHDFQETNRKIREEPQMNDEQREIAIYNNLALAGSMSSSVTRTFSKYGFGIGHLPADVFLNAHTFWYNSQDERQIEAWDFQEIITNSLDSPSHMFYMPCDLKDSLHAQLQVLVSNWINSQLRNEYIPETEAHLRGRIQPIVLETTSLYGIREYEHGARLMPHVDRTKTHACSVIVQIGQTNMKEAWPLEIFDHAGRMHEVTMAEGDIVYYESAHNIHSRVRPMLGGRFANIFAHYRPLLRDPVTGQLQSGDENWYTRPNDLGTVPALTPSDVAKRTTVNGRLDPSAANQSERQEESSQSIFLSEEDIDPLSAPQLYQFWTKNNCPQRKCANYHPHDI